MNPKKRKSNPFGRLRACLKQESEIYSKNVGLTPDKLREEDGDLPRGLDTCLSVCLSLSLSEHNSQGQSVCHAVASMTRNLEQAKPVQFEFRIKISSFFPQRYFSIFLKIC